MKTSVKKRIEVKYVEVSFGIACRRTDGEFERRAAPSLASPNECAAGVQPRAGGRSRKSRANFLPNIPAPEAVQTISVRVHRSLVPVTGSVVENELA
ncbi:MAG: hypothetical protein P4N60_17185 [Verrucomicrobiae bacterium]|nr:hypothetical protein [Verrucomicrobiae bacterium]